MLTMDVYILTSVEKLTKEEIKQNRYLKSIKYINIIKINQKIIKLDNKTNTSSINIKRKQMKKQLIINKMII